MSDGNFIIFDTETTGFKPQEGHRIVEIGAVKMINWRISEDDMLQLYINPERDMPEGAFKVHGLSTEFLQDKPVFNDIAQEFLDFIGDTYPIIAHNAAFDMSFINHHLEEVGYEALPKKRIIDSLFVARKQFPSQSNSLDALCKRFNIDNSNRHYHGALLDSQLLSEVWLELQGGRQDSLAFADTKVSDASENTHNEASTSPYENRIVKPLLASSEEIQQHEEFLKNIPNNIFTHKNDS